MSFNYFALFLYAYLKKYATFFQKMQCIYILSSAVLLPQTIILWNSAKRLQKMERKTKSRENNSSNSRNFNKYTAIKWQFFYSLVFLSLLDNSLAILKLADFNINVLRETSLNLFVLEFI